MSQAEEDFIGDIETMISYRRKPCWFEDSLSKGSFTERSVECWCDSAHKDTAMEIDVNPAPKITFSFSHITEDANVAKIIIQGSEYLLEKKH